MKPNLGYYVQKINDIVSETETIGETMHPYYEKVRTALDKKQTAELTTSQLEEVKAKFSEGTAAYQQLNTVLQGLVAPVKVLGIHKKLQKAFSAYVIACEEMVTAIEPTTPTVNEELFNHSEQAQDDTSDTISFCIQRLTGSLMK